MMMELERQQIADFGRKMSSAGLSAGTSGNLSCYNHELGLMAISPSGIDYFATEPEDIVIMKLDGTIVEGDRRPSSEAPLHAAVYRQRPQAGGVVHTHSPFCTTLACMRVPLKAVHYGVASAMANELPVAPYACFGTPELAKSIEDTLAGCEANGCIMSNHGIVVCADDLPRAFALASSCEFVAELQWRAMCAGEPVVLTNEELTAVRERGKTYGQKK
ncbi:MAG: class II aldolase/adducin family protein [Atopobiaceae bacterium]|nr:class II aldolase/adducin family protein [Atopobiaceae bacterium]